MSLESNCVEKDESHKIFVIDRNKRAVTAAALIPSLLMKELVAIMSDSSLNMYLKDHF